MKRTCQYCGCELAKTSQRKFCSLSCAAKYNNSKQNFVLNDRKKTVNNYNIESIRTSLFGELDNDAIIQLIANSCSVNDVFRKLGRTHVSPTDRQHFKVICDLLDIETSNLNRICVRNLTKGEVLTKRCNYQSFRSSIRRDAYNLYMSHNPNACCCICGYNKHIEVAHIKPVSDFPLETKIKDINDISNLIGLCPNHHWEFDNNCLSNEDIDKIKSLSQKNQLQ